MFKTYSIFRYFSILWLTITLSSFLPAFADIIGGTEVAGRDSIRHSVVALYEQQSIQGGSLCTATLLAQDIAVTAAHCVSSPGKIALIFGHSLKSKGKAVRPVSRTLINSTWTRRQGRGLDQGDIALVRFDGGLPTGYVAIEPLQSDVPLKKGLKVTLAGYGITNSTTHAGAGTLRKTQVTLVDPRPGKTEMILDQTHGKGACHGDSGGPAFIQVNGRLLLAGVTNRGYPDRAPDNCANQVIYTKVSAYYAWIEHGIQELRSP